MSLKTYHLKRDLRRTPEPWRDGQGGSGRRFVVQKHAASRLHYDFRLELGGALKSWAVPKGIPFQRGEKRLAVQVEDHPLSYAGFEGNIPKGQYGGGTVMVWDSGIYKPLTRSPLKDLTQGRLHIELHGKKLSGEWTLVRMSGGKSEWLIVRHGKDLKPLSRRAEDCSAKSGRTMTQIANHGRDLVKPGPTPHRKTHDIPGKIEVMKALSVEEPPSGDWFYEIKFDGWRVLALLGGGNAKIISRNHKDFSERFPDLVSALRKLDVGDAILDGEIVALDARGRSSFQLLQAQQSDEKKPDLFYYAFDLPRLNGVDLRDRPIEVRKNALRDIVARCDGMVRFSDSLGSDYHRLRGQARKLHLEGLIGKRAGSVYESGRRSGAWIKLKIVREQELVVAGYTAPQGSRSYFGSLLVGYYDGKRLVPAGKVGTGFRETLLKSLFTRFQRMGRKTTPFADVSNLSHAEIRSAHWVKPEMVAQVRFKEWTDDGRLRQPVFLGLRDDKPPSEVIREEAG